MPEKTTLSSVINKNTSQVRLIDFLCLRFKYHNNEEWARLIRCSDVKVNGNSSSPEYVLKNKDIVSYSVVLREPPIDSNIKIIHNEESFLVAFKPGNLPVHADGNFIKNTFIYLIKKIMSEEGYFGYLTLVHRLDRETSGLIIVAKSKESNRALARQFEAGAVGKEYIAVVRGVIPDDSFTINGPIAPDPESTVSVRKRVVPAGTPEAQPALTRFSVIERLNGYTVLRCLPATGRTNQIRVHLAHIGHPLAGDKLYGRSDSEFLEFVTEARAGRFDPLPWMDAPRHMLHAYSIGFMHPVYSKPVSFQYPIPEDMIRFIEKIKNRAASH